MVAGTSIKKKKKDGSWDSGFSPAEANSSRCLSDGWPCLVMGGSSLATRSASDRVLHWAKLPAGPLGLSVGHLQEKIHM